MPTTFQPLEQFGGTVLGEFSKGVPGAASLNYGRSGGINCEQSCRHHPLHFVGADSRDGECYAVHVEERHDRVQLKNKLDRHEAAAASALTAKALHELERERLHGRPARPWFRFSTNGALPKPAAALADRLFIPRVRALLAFLNGAGTPSHFPVESPEKAAFYREHVGDLVTVRESIQTPDMTPETIARHPIPAGVSQRARVWALARTSAAAFSPQPPPPRLHGRSVPGGKQSSALRYGFHSSPARKPVRLDDRRRRWNGGASGRSVGHARRARLPISMWCIRRISPPHSPPAPSIRWRGVFLCAAQDVYTRPCVYARTVYGGPAV